MFYMPQRKESGERYKITGGIFRFTTVTTDTEKLRQRRLLYFLFFPIDSRAIYH